MTINSHESVVDIFFLQFLLQFLPRNCNVACKKRVSETSSRDSSSFSQGGAAKRTSRTSGKEQIVLSSSKNSLSKNKQGNAPGGPGPASKKVPAAPARGGGGGAGTKTAKGATVMKAVMKRGPKK